MTLPEGLDLTTYSDEELIEERDFLLRSLRDLDEERRAGDVDAHDYDVLKDGYTARAAAVLRVLDRRRVEPEQVGIAAAVAMPVAAKATTAPSPVAAKATTAPSPDAATDATDAAAEAPASSSATDHETAPASSLATDHETAAASSLATNHETAPASSATDDEVLTAAAGRVAGRPDGAGAAEAAPALRRPRRRLRAVAVAAGVAVFAVGAGLLVAHSAGQRLPGQSLSGSSPNNKVQQLLAQADADFQRSDVIGSLKTLQQVLAIDPRNVVALAQEGWVLAISGNSAHDQAIIDRGLGIIRQAESIDATYAPAHFYAGSVLLNDGNPKGAITEFEDYLADDPSSSTAALVRGDLQTAQAEAAGQVPAGASVAPTTVPGASVPATPPTGVSSPTSAP